LTLRGRRRRQKEAQATWSNRDIYACARVMSFAVGMNQSCIRPLDTEGMMTKMKHSTIGVKRAGEKSAYQP
jgi:hypothetical protein